MSFHPLMPYGEGWHKSERKLTEEGEPFAFTPGPRRPRSRTSAASIHPNDANRRCWRRCISRRSSRAT